MSHAATEPTAAPMPARLARGRCLAGPECTDAQWCDLKAACMPAGPETPESEPTP